MASSPMGPERIGSHDVASFADALGLLMRSDCAALFRIEPRALAVALRGVPESDRAAFVARLPTGTAAQLQQEIERFGPTRRSLVDAAQAYLLQIIRDFTARVR